MKTTVAPGAIVVISVEMTAPKEEGTYTQVWKMQDGEGKPFGIGGPNGAGWYVQIKVSKTGGSTTTGSLSTSATAGTCDVSGNVSFEWIDHSYKRRCSFALHCQLFLYH